MSNSKTKELKEFNVKKIIGFNHNINDDYCRKCGMDLYVGCPLCVDNELKNRLTLCCSKCHTIVDEADLINLTRKGMEDETIISVRCPICKDYQNCMIFKRSRQN